MPLITRECNVCSELATKRIKVLLKNNISKKIISQTMHIPYRIVNSINNGSAWNHIEIDTDAQPTYQKKF